jgi:hypothetical protein
LNIHQTAVEPFAMAHGIAACVRKDDVQQRRL